WIAAGAVALVAGAALALWWMTRAQPDEPVPAPTTASDAARSANRPQRDPIELPGLDGSDTLFRDLVGTLSRNPALARLLATDGLVRRTVLTVEQIGDGRTPSVPLAALRPGTRLAIVGSESGPIDPRSYARWDAAIAALTSVNPQEAAQLYVNLKPLFDAAYADLGYPDGDFDGSITRAIRMLMATPTPTSDPVLLRRPGYYEHTDGTLRALRPVQKQLLLLGPASRDQVLTWLRALASALDLPIT
ncbi:MAG: DUF3014 domain-containing protein, partial [Acidobacteria bacterium]|nr:DUF3014 domain-containing protein [Acidobacteriota bacterium]